MCNVLQSMFARVVGCIYS